MSFDVEYIKTDEEDEALGDDVSDDEPAEEEKEDVFKVEVRIMGANDGSEEEKELFVQIVRKEGSIVSYNDFYK